MDEPNVRRLLRVSRLCNELGHGDDVAAALDEMKRLRAENARLAREAHAWWTAARDAIGEAERLRSALLKIEAGEYLHLPTLVRDALGPNASLSGGRRPSA